MTGPLPDVKAQLLAMAEEDRRVRRALAETGELFSGRYHPEMQAVHDRNARRVQAIVEQHGWPGISIAGPDGAEAAWLLVQHAIEHPELLRTCLPMLWSAAREGEADPKHAAYLEDRIRFFEGRPQRFGTQFEWDESGRLSPWPIEEPDGVEQRREEVGLPPLAGQLDEIRARAESEGEAPPVDPEARRKARLEWARSVGWVELGGDP